MESIITKTIFDSQNSSSKAFIPFVTAGDPDVQTTVEIMHVLDDCGASIIELGVPFTDPMADGPVIQASSQRALENHNISVGDVLKIVELFRSSSSTPIILFGYLNPFYRFGIEDLADRAAGVGVNGLLITDVVDSEFDHISATFGKRNLDLISLVAPTTSDERLETILNSARGFIYAISTTGVTGRKHTLSEQTRHLVKRIRRHSDLPVAVGFGIASKKDIDEVLGYADAAVVGSAIVKTIADSATPTAALESVGEFTKELLSTS